MQLHLHPTCREALTASDTALTRWSLDTNPATILAQVSTAPASVFYHMYTSSGHWHTFGGISGSPDGVHFAYAQHNRLEWHRWNDLGLERAITMPDKGSGIGRSLACSPDGHWLVAEGVEDLFLLNWQTGEVLSQHATGVNYTNGLIFDASSRFVAGVFSNEGGFVKLWRVDPAERFVPRPLVEDWSTHQLVPQDEVSGSMALTLVHDLLGLPDTNWTEDDLAQAPGVAAFHPQNSLLLFLVHATMGEGGGALTAVEVQSGKQLWRTHVAGESTGACVFSPDGSVVLVPVGEGDLLVYRAETGACAQRLCSGLSEPIQALAFDHDGRTLWLATEGRLVQYQSQG